MRDAVQSEGIKLATARSSVVLGVIAIVAPVLLGVLVAVSIPTDVSAHRRHDRQPVQLRHRRLEHQPRAARRARCAAHRVRVPQQHDPGHARCRAAATARPRGEDRRNGRRRRAHRRCRDGVVVLRRIGDPRRTRATACRCRTRACCGRCVGAVVVAGLYALVGLGVGTIIRATAGAITFLVVWPVIVEALLTGFLPSVGKYFPFSAATAAASPDGAKNVLNPYAGGAIFLAFTLAVLIAGGALLSARGRLAVSGRAGRGGRAG